MDNGGRGGTACRPFQHVCKQQAPGHGCVAEPEGGIVRRFAGKLLLAFGRRRAPPCAPFVNTLPHLEHRTRSSALTRDLAPSAFAVTTRRLSMDAPRLLRPPAGQRAHPRRLGMVLLSVDIAVPPPATQGRRRSIPSSLYFVVAPSGVQTALGINLWMSHSSSSSSFRLCSGLPSQRRGGGVSPK